jgi:hypothetical protein
MRPAEMTGFIKVLPQYEKLTKNHVRVFNAAMMKKLPMGRRGKKLCNKVLIILEKNCWGFLFHLGTRSNNFIFY